MAGAFLLWAATGVRGGTEVNDSNGRDCGRKLVSRRAEYLQQPWNLRLSSLEITAFRCLPSLSRDDEKITEVTNKTFMVRFEPLRRVERVNFLVDLLKGVERSRAGGS